MSVMSAWSQPELEMLADTALSLKEVAQRTGRTQAAVEHKAIRLRIDRSFRIGSGLRRGDDHPYAAWELALVDDVDVPLSEVARRTGRSYGGVKRMASVRGRKRHPGWTAQELGWLADTDLPLIQVAELTGKPLGTVYSEASRREIARGAPSGDQHYRWVGESDSYRGAEWPKVRQEVLERDGSTCQDCGAAGEHVHHIIPWRLCHSNDQAWLVTLCSPCHTKRPEHRWVKIPEDIVLLLAGGGGVQ